MIKVVLGNDARSLREDLLKAFLCRDVISIGAVAVFILALEAL